MIRKLLLANRGEIAVRILRSAAAAGIRTVAVFARDEAHALHVRHADEAIALKATGAAAYLDAGALIAAAGEAGCDAVHPGYGFLSESAGFARACADAGLIFVGPDPETLAALGDKTMARALARKCGVPVAGGSEPLASPEAARAAFDDLGGGPVLLKALAGGGGRGMRLVRSASEIETAFARAEAEAQAAFGDGRLYAERFLHPVRHIEVQIVGDGQDITHLWERDCTLQRRHQKIVEIAPAPHLDPSLRRQLLEAARTLGRAAHYRGIGTIEFLVATDGFVFIEANPRIQVEHTITEEITGHDLVALQLRLAEGASLAELGLDGPPVRPQGMAIQLRINAETQHSDGSSVPSGGRLMAFQPPTGPGVRVDTAAFAGQEIGPNYDSLLAKVIVHDRGGDLNRLLRRAERALSECDIRGVATNTPFLRALLTQDALKDWLVHVTAIDEGLVGSLPENMLQRHSGPVEDVTEVRPEIPLPQGSTALRAPMMGMLQAISVAEGDAFAAGQELAVLEAMKMQHGVTAPVAGRVTAILAEPGSVVAEDSPLLAFAPVEGSLDESVVDAPDPETIRADLAALQERIALTLDASRPAAVERRRARGQRTARENVDDLCRGGRFHEYGQLVIAAQRRRRSLDDLQRNSPADGIVTGLGEINADLVGPARAQTAILAYDGTVMAGTQGFLGHHKTDRLFEVAEKNRLPVVFLTEGGGGRPGDVDFADVLRAGLGVTTFHAFARMTAPRITVNAGYCFAGNAALFGAGDIRIATRDSWIGLGGPAMIEAGGLGTFQPTDIGPAPMQARIGLVDILADDEPAAVEAARRALSYTQGDLPKWQARDQRALRHAIPENRLRAYDIRTVITGLADDDSFLELGRDHAPGMVSGFIRMEGRSMGLIANNPHHLGGALDAPASSKAARFLRLCARLRLPVLSLCDTPGFMVGPASEEQGGVAAACDFLAAGSTLGQPLFFVCLRKGYGIGAQAMAGGSFVTPDFTISWPTGEFGPMGLEGAVTLGFRKELEATPDPAARKALFHRLVDESYETGSALNIASLNEIDAVIDPAETRSWIVKGLDATRARSG
ncbi:carboxyl transferase domain-containing protein [Seohaeicola nanhaiensis]|uniref:Carboxyl transferase domain-containing protein n=1 Tax=Seohaeicola nanhaiensis TaxID=1387282 RepID=A0ABV9KD93_9RHOB